MSDYPLRGEGIEIRKNEADSDEDRRKYNIHVHEDLFVAVKNGLDPDTPEELRWRQDAATGRWVLGYLATDENFDSAAGDARCH